MLDNGALKNAAWIGVTQDDFFAAMVVKTDGQINQKSVTKIE